MILEALSGKLRRMHHVTRYSSVPVIRRENVAEHSWQVAMLGFLIGSDINYKHGETIVDVGQVVIRAISHDVSEAVSGDIIRSYKHSSDIMREACAAADRINMAELVHPLEAAGDQLYGFWQHAKDADLEGDIVEFCDMMCVVSYCVEESRLGNTMMDFVLEELYVKKMCEVHLHRYLGKYMDEIFPSGNWADPYDTLGR